MMVTTGEVEKISISSAEVTGNVIDIGEGISQYGHCYGIEPNVSISDLKTELGIRNKIGIYTSILNNLYPNTKYFIKAYICKDNEILYGNEISFTTNALSVPSLTTSEVSAIKPTNATCGGEITNDGGTSVTSRGICWDTLSNPTLTKNNNLEGSGTGNFTSIMNNLLPGTRYYVKAFAVNSIGTAYGNQVEFITAEYAKPQVISVNATFIENTTAVLNGKVNANGLTATISFEYGTSNLYGSTIAASETPLSDTNLTNISATISGLISGQLYHFRAKAVSDAGISYGSDLVFTTTVKDFDGNSYPIISIGEQTWFTKNLMTTTLKNGSSIQKIEDNTEWINSHIASYCWYNNDETNYRNSFGAIYNWYSVNTGELCPSGWHVPTDAEWTILENYLGDPSTAGNKLKAISGWNNSGNGTNESGFNGLPSGDRYGVDGLFYQMGNNGTWWSSTSISEKAYERYLNYSQTTIGRDLDIKEDGFSVRCLRD